MRAYSASLLGNRTVSSDLPVAPKHTADRESKTKRESYDAPKRAKLQREKGWRAELTLGIWLVCLQCSKTRWSWCHRQSRAQGCTRSVFERLKPAARKSKPIAGRIPESKGCDTWRVRRAMREILNKIYERASEPTKGVTTPRQRWYSPLAHDKL